MKNICCTCLSRDRKLFQLCRISNGVNNLYILLSLDVDSYREAFYQDTAKLYVCWECEAIFRRLSLFRSQACNAQKLLMDIDNGRLQHDSQATLSKLTIYKQIHNQTDFVPTLDNFVDCGECEYIKEEKYTDSIPADIKTENNETYLIISGNSDNLDINYVDDDAVDDVKDNETVDDIINDKSDADKLINETRLKSNEVNVKNEWIYEEVLVHQGLEDFGHEKQEKVKRRKELPNKKSRRKNKPTKSEAPITRRSKLTTDERTPLGFKCPECEEYFGTKNSRYKHVLRRHREGYECDICGKRVKLKDLLAKHIRLHQSPIPREECPSCQKMVRSDLMKVHARIHSARERFACVECGKDFACRGSYELHLKYSKSHADIDLVKKYKCEKCDKGYKSRGELDDHVNYKHLGKTRHECPLCGKALASRRCIKRHVKRAHENIKEGQRDKICQQCGKAFRDKKSLREHEFIHTGERPLSCELCDRTFRQRASLYTHRKRVHKICPQKRDIQLVHANK